ncbi:hypothetical protein LTS18_000908, partial [Coniosporium uncinatum]
MAASEQNATVPPIHFNGFNLDPLQVQQFASLLTHLQQSGLPPPPPPFASKLQAECASAPTYPPLASFSATPLLQPSAEFSQNQPHTYARNLADSEQREEARMGSEDGEVSENEYDPYQPTLRGGDDGHKLQWPETSRDFDRHGPSDDIT